MRRRRDEDNGFEGGYMRVKIAKLEDQFNAKATEERHKVSDIFQGISIFVNGWTDPSADELKTLMSRHGGIYHTYRRTDDYIVATNLPDSKVRKISKERIVRPEWITESITANKLLDYRDFLLYSKHTRSQPKLNFNKNMTNIHINPTHHDSKIENASGPLRIVNQTMSEDKNSRMPENNTISVLENTVKQATIDNSAKSVVTRTAVDPRFLSEFYSNSRLHHISQLGAGFKQYINELRETSNFKFSALSEYKKEVRNMALPFNPISKEDFDGQKIIMHIDMDCFFVSCGLRNKPELKGMPVAVTHAKNTQAKPLERPGADRELEFGLYKQRRAEHLSKVIGKPESEILEEGMIKTRLDGVKDHGSLSEIASCSYEARAKGVRNGMFMGSALKLCPDLVTIPYDFEIYKEVAFTLYNTIAKYTLDIEAVSCDEMYVDCTDIISQLGTSAQQFASALRKEIQEATGCPCSTGFGGNRLQARLATKRAKPNGQFFLTADEVEEFMAEIKLSDLPGVGHQTSQRLAALGHSTCGSLLRAPLSVLQRHLGNKTGEQLYNQCRGYDPKPLTFHTVRKSVSAEVNYGIRFENDEQCETFLKQLCCEVQSRLKQFKVAGKSITLKLMVRAEDAPVETAKFMGHGFCDVVNKTTSLPKSTDELDVITNAVLDICKKQNVKPKDMRGIGIHVSKLESVVNKNQCNGLAKYFKQAKTKEEVERSKPSNKYHDDEVTVQTNDKSIYELVERISNKSKPTEIIPYSEPSTSKTYSYDQHDNKTSTVSHDFLDKKDVNLDVTDCTSASKSTENLKDSSEHVSTTPKKIELEENEQKVNTPIKFFRSPPKFQTLLSPTTKKSPVKNKSPPKKTLGLRGRRRGRPPRHISELTKPPQEAKVMNNFVTGKNPPTEDSPNVNTLSQSILDALPEDILHEVLENYSAYTKASLRLEKKVKKTEESSSKIMKKTNQNEPAAEAAASSSSAITVPGAPGIFALGWREVREMARAWVAAGAAPLPCDVDLISTYLQSMVVHRRLDKLYVLINFLRRKCREKNEQEWEDACSHIIEGVQETMMSIYGKKLLLYE